MNYLIRVAVAIITFAIGSGLAGWISPSYKESAASRRNGCAKNKKLRTKASDNGNLDPKWVFVKKDLIWREAPYLSTNDGSDPGAVVESAPTEIAVFYPSGEFALVICDLYRNAVAKDEIYYDDLWKVGFVYRGSWRRTSPTEIITVTDVTRFTPGILDHPYARHLEGKWAVSANEPQGHEVLYENTTPYVHLKNFASFRVLSSYLEKPATYQYVNAN
jgi:hypothetical protein